MTAIIRLFVIDDQPAFRVGLQSILEQSPEFDVIGAGCDLQAGVSELISRNLRPDVVIIGTHPIDRSAVAAIRTVSQLGDGALEPPRVLVLSPSASDEMLVSSLAAGARGFLVKSATPTELKFSVQIVANGGAVFGRDAAHQLSAHFLARRSAGHRATFPELTDREREILDLIASGLTNAGIAAQLTLAEKTVRNHVSHIFTKLRVCRRVEAVVRARAAGLGDG